MAIANFDEIIRRILGLNKPLPDDANVFEELPGYAEDEILPMKDPQWDSYLLTGPAQQLPYSPGQDKYFVGPSIIPNTNEQDAADLSKRTPLRRGNAKNGSGIDI